MKSSPWIVQHGRLTVLGPSARFAEPLYDDIALGPQHLDAKVEEALRRTFGAPSDLSLLDGHAERLADGITLLAEPELRSTMAALWWIDRMSERGHDVAAVRLAITADRYAAAPSRRAVAAARPLGDDVEPLRRLRRAIASDDDKLDFPRAGVSRRTGTLVRSTEQMLGWLPDRRGLDVLDERILLAADRRWRPAARIVGETMATSNRDHRIGDGLVWDRMRELAEDRSVAARRTSAALLEVEIDGPPEMRFSRARRTALADEVLKGRDALELRRFDRWLGGRFLTRERVMREGLRR